MNIQRREIYFVNLNAVNCFFNIPAGQISESKMVEIETAIRYCLGL